MYVNLNFVTTEFNASKYWEDKVPVHRKLSFDKVQNYDSYVTKQTKSKLHNCNSSFLYTPYAWLK